VVVQLIGITLWMSWKERALVNIADRYLGWGDILFFIPMALLFPPIFFVYFYVGSLLMILVGFLLYQAIAPNPMSTIPLAGGLALCLIVTLLFIY